MNELENLVGTNLIETNEEKKIVQFVEDKDNLHRGIRKIRGKYKQKSFDDYISEHEKTFDDLQMTGKIDATLTINSIPNEREFHKLIKVLKARYGSGIVDFVIVDHGYTTFYFIYKSSRLFDIIKVIDKVNSSFYSEKLEDFKPSLTEAIPGTRSEKRVVLHISRKQKGMISALLEDIRVSESNFGLICCILTFNRAKERFENFITEKYEAFYDDDGYVKLIQTEIDRATVNGINWLINSLETMFWEIDGRTKEYLYDPESADQKLMKYIRIKRDAMNDAIEMIESSDIEIRPKNQLLISSFKEDMATIPLKEA
jgi:hypothetical protein